MKVTTVAIFAVLLMAWMFRYENYKNYGVASDGSEIWHRNRITNAVCPIDQDCFLYTFPDNLIPWHCIGLLTKWCRWNWGTAADRAILEREHYWDKQQRSEQRETPTQGFKIDTKTGEGWFYEGSGEAEKIACKDTPEDLTAIREGDKLLRKLGQPVPARSETVRFLACDDPAADVTHFVKLYSDHTAGKTIQHRDGHVDYDPYRDNGKWEIGANNYVLSFPGQH